MMLLILSLTTWSQEESFRNRFNLSAFGGYFAEQRNANNNGENYGIYADFMVLKTWSGWNLGPYVIWGNNGFIKNMIPYESQSRELGGGINIGYYSEYFSTSRQIFIGLGLGYKYLEENAESIIPGGPNMGHYTGEQIDRIGLVSINGNLMKNSWTTNPQLFPRIQLIASFQLPLTAKKTAYWNEEAIPDSTYSPWDKTFLDVLLKQSIVDWSWGEKMYCSPKAIFYYSYSFGAGFNTRNTYAAGLELAWHRPGKDDFLSCNLTYRLKDMPGKQSFTFGINVNLGSLISK
jgi:hypothetical protein